MTGGGSPPGLLGYLPAARAPGERVELHPDLGAWPLVPDPRRASQGNLQGGANARQLGHPVEEAIGG
eukprot:CAMPEP_0177612260 /NCGR_PEP_ID=MMETSP0419_2-20121207/21097_1 /TAXON_ID=582737 /ORGANISM="Tetraselmis sp., Strain GSL018" /LENGTH=66 /DNA_ID=CAMNT_0019108379 /DNA_START=835 /DNA_END=1036 /DNA_ORIENTATION=-